MKNANARNPKNFKGNANWTTLAGRDGVENRELNEFAATAKELAPYKKLIPMMTKINEKVVTTNTQKRYYTNTFAFRGMKGKGIVIHNANVGTWGKRTPVVFSENDDIKIDAQGNMISYVPLKAPAKVEFTLKNAKDTVFDFKTGKKIPTVNGKGSVDVAPGSGVILFAGSAQDFNKIRSAIK